MNTEDLQNSKEKLQGVWRILFWTFIGGGSFWILLFSFLSWSGVNLDNLGRSGKTIAATRGARGVHVFHK